nr:CsbD family protein [uncultured Rhodopila sp.]
MDKDRIIGSAKQVEGTLRETAGKVLGDARLAAEGREEKAEGKIQNAVGGAKDIVKDALNN